MAIKDFKRISTQDETTNRLQGNIQEFFKQLTSNPLLDGNLIEDVAVSTTAVEVNHGLGREPVGYITVKADANVTIYDTTSTTPKVTLKLTASATATVSLYIF